MITAAFGSLSGRIGSSFLTAYLMPAFVALFAVSGIALAHIGVAPVMTMLENLDSFEQGLGVLIGVLLTVVLAFLLRAFTLPLFDLFTGVTLPEGLADRMIRSQIEDRRRRRRSFPLDPAAPPTTGTARHRAVVFAARFPEDE
ncbi:MAG: hypothetical protein ACR2J8_00720, partial [Thermomicrobiales bacterium]